MGYLVMVNFMEFKSTLCIIVIRRPAYFFALFYEDQLCFETFFETSLTNLLSTWFKVDNINQNREVIT